MKNIRKKPTITVGISAYNEEQNIKYLLQALLKQKVRSGTLREIIIVSDGSTDMTVERARSVNDTRIKLIDRKNRIGLNLSQNEVFAKARGDILVALDADIIPYDEDLIEELLKPILKSKNIGLVSGSTIPAFDSRTYVEKVLNLSHNMKYEIYQSMGSQNIYLCHGRVRAFVKPLYSAIRWPNDVPEDAFSYLFAKSQGYRFVFNKKAKIRFRCPSTIRDHALQSLRFIDGKENLKKYFPKHDIDAAYALPKSVFLRSFIEYMRVNPLMIFSYVFLQIYVRQLYSKTKIDHSKYFESKSSKLVL